MDQILDLLPVLVPTAAVTAAVTVAGKIILELVRGRNRVAEIKATSDADIRKLRAELQLERERNRALTTNQLSIGPPPG